MSSRNIRKLYGTTTLPPPEGSSDEEFKPLYTKSPAAGAVGGGGAYAGLDIDSNSDVDAEADPTSENADSDKKDETSKVDKKRKKNNRKKGRRKQDKQPLQMDEIEKSLQEVNAMLGTPTPALLKAAHNKEPDPEAIVYRVQQKYLDANSEMDSLFGPEEADNPRREEQDSAPSKCRPALGTDLADPRAGKRRHETSTSGSAPTSTFSAKGKGQGKKTKIK